MNPDEEIDPPDDWQPSTEAVRQMREAPLFEVDLHLGGASEEMLGEKWLSGRTSGRIAGRVA